MQSRLRKFIKLQAADRRLLGSAAAALVKARLLVMFVPIRKILQPVTPRAGVISQGTEAAKIGWAVETAGRIVPAGGNCLVRAIAGREMLARRGIGSHVRVGVAKNSPDLLRAHAWLECGDRIITGEGEHRNFAALPVGEHYGESGRLEMEDGIVRTPSSVENP
ncbi:lasso peptide biosynthesis B2 protein [Candidatus Binatus sp.]|uniref:lasso peptide biosynthesis B2 protein n=1 Tax=Candidatus Binatus sp. TaxID=2811406 RepID=UPI003C8CC076